MAQSPPIDGRGHNADKPSDIPKPGWRSILRRVYTSTSDKNLSVLAAGVAFYGMLSMFPALAVLVAIYGLFADPATVQHEINTIGGLIPGEAQKLIAEYLKSLASSSSSRLGISLLISLLIALWSARAGTVTVIEALNITYEESEKRSTLKFEAVALAMTVADILFAIVALLLVAAIPAVVKFLSPSIGWRIVGFILPWPILIVAMVFALAVTYRFAPSREAAKWRWVSWGSVFATVLWIAASIGFSFYVTSFGSYDKTFGSLGAVVVLLTWFYISAYVILLGACLDAEMERQTARDTTTGPEKPMGSRGAKMADTVAHDGDSSRVLKNSSQIGSTGGLASV
jgi:membrane protein